MKWQQGGRVRKEIFFGQMDMERVAPEIRLFPVEPSTGITHRAAAREAAALMRTKRGHVIGLQQ